MCGIVATLSKDRPVGVSSLEAAVRALRHRGPDAQRTWISPDGRAGVGHPRLSVSDLSPGDQPLGNEDGSIRGVVNGELYDFERIQRELEARGHRLRTKSDSEIALHLYEDHGPRCLEHLRGE